MTNNFAVRLERFRTQMHVLWFFLIIASLCAIVWRHQLWSYVRGRPYLSNGLRRYVNKTTRLRPTVLVTDADQRDLWAQDLCGATPASLREFVESPSTPECVVSIVDERLMDPEARSAFYHKLESVPHIIRIRSRITSVPEDVKEFDALGVISKMGGNVVIERTND